MERVLQAADRWQHRHRWLSFRVAAWKKFGDFLGARGVAAAAQNALNAAWEVPFSARPGFGWART
jgi:hypothetical protein